MRGTRSAFRRGLSTGLLLRWIQCSRLPRQRNVARQAPKAKTVQAPSTRAVRPCSQAPAASEEANESGRKTERRPCAIHLSGNTAAITCMNLGIVGKRKKTPEIICRDRNGNCTTAAAERAFGARRLYAMPASEHAVMPSVTTQARVAQRAGLS